MNRFFFVVFLATVLALVVVVLTGGCVGHQASKDVTFTPVEVLSYEEVDRRIITWSSVEEVTPEGAMVVKTAVRCRHEPSGEPCSFEEYNELEGIGE